MSASSRLRFGAVAAGLSCVILSYAAAEQNTTAAKDRTEASASGQTDRTTTEQTDPSATSTARAASELDQNQTNYRVSKATAGGQNQTVDHVLASCLLGQSQAEVQLGEIAQQKSENDEVKQFAKKMIEDHGRMIAALQPLAKMQSMNRGSSSILGGHSESQGRSEATEGRTSDTTALPGSSGANQTITPSGTSATIRPADATAGTATREAATTMAGGGAVHQLMQIDRQINDRCLQMAKDELQQKSGAEFDKCYISSAIGAHVHALAALEVIGKQTQGKLAQVAQQAQPTVQQHLDHAKKLMKQLDGQAGATGTQAQRDAKRTE